MKLIRLMRLLPALAALAVLFVATAMPALAADPVSLEMRAPKRVNLGDVTDVTVELRDGRGGPVPGAAITFWTSGSFLSVGGAMELGRAITDSQGRATFGYQTRSEKSAVLNARFLGDSRYASAQASAEVEVLGSAQLYQSAAGVRVGGIGVWFLAGLVGGVWATYFAVMVLLTFIAREGVSKPSAEGAAPDA